MKDLENPGGQGSLNYETKQFIDQVFQEEALELKMQIQSAISNLHIELIRSMTFQEQDLVESL